MEMHQDDRPPAYTQLRSDSLVLPSVPTHAPGAPQQQNDRLPGIRALDLPDASPASSRTRYSRSSVELSPRAQAGNAQWNPLPPLSGNGVVGRRQDVGPRESDFGSPMDTGSVVSAHSDYGDRRETSVLSVDDPDVRLAAEALSGLGNPDYARSPSRSITIPRSPPVATEPEPLLSLITSNHPWLGGTINGSISAYNATKSYTPNFVQRGAELIERNIGSPVVNTVSSVGRRTGMEKNLRKYLGEHRRPSDLEQADSESARKRQRVMNPAEDAMDFEQAIPAPRTGTSSRASFAESLPAYDDHRSPNYEESVATAVDPATGKEMASHQHQQNLSQDRTGQQHQQQHLSQDRRVNWPTQLIMTTSGLGVALSDRSLQSLKTCLGYLRNATSHIDSVMHALKLLLEEYETAVRNQQQQQQQDQPGGTTPDPESGAMDTTTSSDTTPTPSDAASDPTAKDEQIRQIADRMKGASSEIWGTIRHVTSSVSRYTGGALPQNASQIVRLQLLSVPQRWETATSATAGAGEDGVRGETAMAAQRMLAFAREGLDMMGQITRVIDGTVTSAEGWLARIGRRPGGGPGEGSGSGRAGEEGTTVRGGEKREFVIAVHEKR